MASGPMELAFFGVAVRPLPRSRAGPFFDPFIATRLEAARPRPKRRSAERLGRAGIALSRRNKTNPHVGRSAKDDHRPLAHVVRTRCQKFFRGLVAHGIGKRLNPVGGEARETRDQRSRGRKIVRRQPERMGYFVRHLGTDADLFVDDVLCLLARFGRRVKPPLGGSARRRPARFSSPSRQHRQP